MVKKRGAHNVVRQIGGLSAGRRNGDQEHNPNGRTGNTLEIADILDEPPARFDTVRPLHQPKGNVSNQNSYKT